MKSTNKKAVIIEETEILVNDWVYDLILMHKFRIRKRNASVSSAQRIFRHMGKNTNITLLQFLLGMKPNGKGITLRHTINDNDYTVENITIKTPQGKIQGFDTNSILKCASEIQFDNTAAHSMKITKEGFIWIERLRCFVLNRRLDDLKNKSDLSVRIKIDSKFDVEAAVSYEYLKTGRKKEGLEQLNDVFKSTELCILWVEFLSLTDKDITKILETNIK